MSRRLLFRISHPLLVVALTACAGTRSVTAGVALGGSQETAPSGPQTNSAEIAKLLAIVRNKELREREPKRVVEAIQRLGELRVLEAVDDLVQLITFRRTFDWERSDMIVEIQPIHIGNRYPATSALFQIGAPALPALVEVIEQADLDSVEAKNAGDAVMSIFREDLPAASEYLRGVATRASSMQEAQRLVAAADYFDVLLAKSKAFPRVSDPYSIRAVKSLLEQPAGFSTGWSEKQVNRLGDRFSDALLRMLDEKQLADPDNIRKFLPLIRDAFASPGLIAFESDKKPDVTLFVLRYLDREVKDPKLKHEILATADFVREKTVSLE
jgi:hypothetical protein